MMAPPLRHRPLNGFYELIDLPRIPDRRGTLTVIEGGGHVPFDIARVYYLYDVPASATRAGHAHHRLMQLLIATSGSFDVNLDNGFEKAILHLDRPVSRIAAAADGMADARQLLGRRDVPRACLDPV